MPQITCRDGANYSGSAPIMLYQWDSDRTMVLGPFNIGSGVMPKFRFSNCLCKSPIDVSSYSTYEGTMNAAYVAVQVPDILLYDHRPITLSVMNVQTVVDPISGNRIKKNRTIATFRLPVWERIPGAQS